MLSLAHEISQMQKDTPCVIAHIQSTPRIVQSTETGQDGGCQEPGKGMRGQCSMGTEFQFG